MIYAKQLIMARSALGLSRPQLARRTNLGPSTIWRIEMGKSYYENTGKALRQFFSEQGITFSDDAETMSVTIKKEVRK